MLDQSNYLLTPAPAASFFPFENADGLLAGIEKTRKPKSSGPNPPPLTNYLSSREHRFRLRSFQKRYGYTSVCDCNYFRDLSKAGSLKDLEKARESYLKLSSLNRRLEEARATHASYVDQLQSQASANKNGAQRSAG